LIMDVILVMNPQNSFLSDTGSVYMGAKAETLKLRLQDYLSSFHKVKIFCRESHAPGDSYFSGDKTHSVATTEDFLVPDSLKKYANYFIDKTRFSGLFDTLLEATLKQNSVRSVGLIGVETHTSILFTAGDLRNRGYEVTVVEPCVMARDDYFHAFSISLMNHYMGVKISNG